ncbi:MAG: TonB family protein [Terriglobales bacterium]|jgi:periplasmic protein TonB
MSNQESVSYAARAPFAPAAAGQGRSRVASDADRSSLMSNVGPDAIWGHYNNYRSNGLAVSAVVHAVLIGLILVGATFHSQIAQKIQPHETVTLIAPSPDTYTLAPAKKEVGGGGGGGEHAKLEAPKGKLPKMAMTQITPPSIVVRNEKPKLAVEPTVVAPPQIQVAENHMPTLGDPKSVLPSAPPSNGIGSGGGIGSGTGGGVGVGHGPGVGQGTGGGIGGGVFKVGGGISAPKPVSTPEAQYTEDARNAKTQGTCILWLIVDTEGHPRDIRVVHGPGHGLEAKAVEAVKQWRFEPAMKDGKPVNVQISVEVGFKLY